MPVPQLVQFEVDTEQVWHEFEHWIHVKFIYSCDYVHWSTHFLLIESYKFCVVIALFSKHDRHYVRTEVQVKQGRLQIGIHNGNDPEPIL